MSDCCAVPDQYSATDHACPRCGSVGRIVNDTTIVSILNPAEAASLLAGERRFCGTPACDVLYYGVHGRTAGKDASRVRVGIKEIEDPILLCYCFGFTRVDLRSEVQATGDSTIPTRIAAEVNAHCCSCEEKNPSGACCLGEVNKALAEAKLLLSTSGTGRDG